MKKGNLELNSIFAVAREMVETKGEDCLYYNATDDKFIVAAFDGCGGSGSKKYENYSGKTGAYVASRAVCGGVKSWFEESGRDDKLSGYIGQALEICKAYGDKAGRIMGSLGKAFPTTIAFLAGKIEKNYIDLTAYWAGDSRCYLLDANGLHQLTEDDLDGQDAMSNLYNDGVMTNVVNASSPFEIHMKKIIVENPCILFAATDGCFGYLNSPMAFEHLVTDSLVNAANIAEWKGKLFDRMGEVAGDDYTMSAAVFGFKDFADIKKGFEERNRFVRERYIDAAGDVHEMWNEYKLEYSKYLTVK